MIAHFDIDAFYASVAQRDDTSLIGKPVAIAGASRRAVVLTASYEARRYGVRSAMPLFKARTLCSELVVVAPDFERYRELSRAAFAIFGAGARTLEGLSLDEAFVELATDALEEAAAYAKAVRARVRAELGLTVSAGVSARKMVAKIASDTAKPDGLAAIPVGSEAAFLAPLPAGRLWGIGPKTQARLAAEGIVTIGEIAALDDGRTFRLFGRSGRELRELARGNDPRPVCGERETRSVSSEQTFEEDISAEAQLRAWLRELAHDVARRLTQHGLRGATIGIKVKRADFTIVGRQISLAEPTDDAATIEAAAVRCLQRVELAGKAVRLLGVRAASLTEERTRQPSLF